MKLIIQNGDNISLTDSLGKAYELIGNFGLNELITACENIKKECSSRMKDFYACIGESEMNHIGFHIVYENSDSLTITVSRIRKDN